MWISRRCILVALGVVLTLLENVTGEVFTAMAEVEELLEGEKVVVGILENYLQEEEERLHKIRQYVRGYKETFAAANDDFEKFIAHPVNAYLVVKQLTTDWKEAEDLLNQALGREYLQSVYKQREKVKFPTDEDLTGVAVALSRLQDTYRLDSYSIAKGKIKGIAKSPKLSARECFELGRVLYNHKDYDHSIDWMKTALYRLDDHFLRPNETLTRTDIYEYLAFGSYLKGEVKDALKFTIELLDNEPTHERAQNNKWHYERELEVSVTGKKKGDDGFTVESKKKMIEKKLDSWADDRREYEVLCRGEKQPSRTIMNRLKCFHTADHPYLILQPVQSELVHLDPDIIVYHNLVSDSEMATIKSLAVPRLQRATVQNPTTGELETAHYRVSKSAWLNANEDPVIARVNQRIGHITGLDMDFAEELQIANYGIGGHYEPHFDFARKAETKAFSSLGMGNRVATMLIYMTDVEAGGGTVFPRLSLTLWPKKGSGAFWYNLFKNGEGDFRTRHAACPVLAGVKWVSNKWIHEYGQERRRPCDLSPDGYEPDEIM